MAGAFAHMAVVDSLCDDPGFLGEAGPMGEKVRYAITKHKEFCELGAVSPDLPYLDIGNDNSIGWANVMHYWNTADIIRSGIRWFAEEKLEDKNPDVQRATAWLFGYAAHVATDLTVHPVLLASGYAYDTNPKGHRFCELNQDAYVFKKIKGNEAGTLRYIENCGIASCKDPKNAAKLHPAIRKLWKYCLADIAPKKVYMKNGAAGPTGKPTPDDWFADYTKRVSQFVEQGGGFGLLFREVLEFGGFCMPESDEIDMKYIVNLKTPKNGKVNYDAVFEMALANVRKTWLELVPALAARDQQSFTLQNANLDNGLADNNQRQIFYA